MEVIFKDDSLREIYESGKTNHSRYKTLCRNKKLVDGFRRAIGIMYSVPNAGMLSAFSFLHYEKLRHQSVPRSSVRIMNGAIERLIYSQNRKTAL